MRFIELKDGIIMSIMYKTDKENVDWNQVADILNNAGLSEYDSEHQKIIFGNSYAVVFVYDDDYLIGVARAISDGVCQAAVYNVALRPEYHGKNIGTTMVNELLAQLEGQNVILYTIPFYVGYYERFGFRRSKTTMCRFAGTKEHLEMMEEKGFMLPVGFRYDDEHTWL